MLTHEQLMEEWEKDSLVDRTKLMDSLYRHPILHSKYLTHLQTYKFQLRKHVLKYQTIKLLKQRYFNGELSKDELKLHGWSQYLLKKPLKSEMESLLDADAELQKIQEQSVYLENLCSACESILKELNTRTYLYRSMIDYEKFLSGA